LSYEQSYYSILTGNQTTDSLEKYFRSKAAVEVIAQAFVVISFAGDICCLLETLALERFPVAEMTFQSHSTSLQIALFDRSQFLRVFHWNYLVPFPRYIM